MSAMFISHLQGTVHENAWHAGGCVTADTTYVRSHACMHQLNANSQQHVGGHLG